MRKVVAIVTLFVLLTVSLVVANAANNTCYFEDVRQVSVTMEVPSGARDNFLVSSPDGITYIVHALCHAATIREAAFPRDVYATDKFGHGMWVANDGTVIGSYKNPPQWNATFEFTFRYYPDRGHKTDRSWWIYESDLVQGSAFLLFLPKWGAGNPHVSWNTEISVGVAYDIYNAAHEYAGYQ